MTTHTPPPFVGGSDVRRPASAHPSRRKLPRIPGGRATTWLALLGAIVLSACGSENPSAPPEPVQTTPDLRFGQVIWTDTLDAVVAYSHCDHWHGSIRLHDQVNQPLKLWFAPACQADHSEPPKSVWFSLTGKTEYTGRVELQDPTIALYDGTRDRFMVQPRRVGSSPSVIVVRRDGRVVYRDPAFPTSVVP